MAHLTLVVQGREVRKFVLNPTVTTIGRAQENDIVINNLALSRRHAEVSRRRGRFEVEDKGSQNGVFVNSERIDGPTALTNADTITLGTYHFVFSADEAKDPDIRAARKPRALEVTQLEEPEDLSPEPEPKASPLLVLKYNDVELQRFPITGTCLVGRAKDCDIQIAERRLSRRHCKLSFDGKRVEIEDLGSQNGTYVNRRRIPERYTVKHGDVLNFAEYSILYLSDAEDYDGPDLENVAGRKAAAAPRPMSGIEKEETEFPEAYEDYKEPKAPSIIPEDDLLHPQDLEDPEDARPAAPVATMPRRSRHQDPADREVFVEQPDSSRERRSRRTPGDGAPKKPKRKSASSKEPSRPPRTRERVVRAKNVVAKPSRPNPHTKPIAGRVEAKEHADIDDRRRDARPDSALDDWFAARDDDDPYDEEPSVLLERSKSSMSQLLSTMMVDKRELDKNLSVRAKQRRFLVEVRHGKDVVYDGPLREQVTILGRDREADIQIKGRYVAARHSLLVRVKDSLLLVRLGSSSAARVNGLPKLQAFLKTGDVVQIDETTIKIREE